jgi:uncharacterized membrane protein
VTKGRVEAFSDGVIAIIITIMVLELKVPHGAEWSALRPLLPVFVAYLVSFVYLGIYWNNHHHLFHAVKHVDGRVLWSNLHLLFWLSLVPVVTHWIGEHHRSVVPVTMYGVVLLGAAIAYSILVRALLARHGRESALAQAIGRDFKGIVSVALYVVAILAARANTWVAIAIYGLVAAMWLVPDTRIERHLPKEAS